MNIIGIDVSQGESHATLITEEAEKVAFKFKHNKSGFQILNSYIRSNTIIIF
ncbi:IS110 family transposase, partial [Lactobacillus amylovorus]|nr:IS110 family transposase [Lactobacillus amylovorus]